MDYTFLKTDAEGYALYASVFCYLAAITIVLTRYLKIIRNKKLDEKIVRSKTRKVRVCAVLGILIYAILHIFLFLIFFELFPDEKNFDSIPRTSYYFSILLTMAVFSFFMWFGMYLRGTHTLPKHQAPATGV